MLYYLKNKKGLPMASPNYVYTNTRLPLRQVMMMVDMTVCEHVAKIAPKNIIAKNQCVFIKWH
jgi:hypothetical protein